MSIFCTYAIIVTYIFYNCICVCTSISIICILFVCHVTNLALWLQYSNKLTYSPHSTEYAYTSTVNSLNITKPKAFKQDPNPCRRRRDVV